MFTSIFAEGVLRDMKSDMAISSPTIQATVVKKPKTFWPLTKEECMMAIKRALVVQMLDL